MKNQTNYIAHLKKSKWTRSALYFHLPLALLTALTLNHCSDSGGGGNGGISSGGPQPNPACGLAVSSTTGFHGKGDGSTAAKPYVICTFAQLRKIKDGLAKHYALGKDIDASSNQWGDPIGSKSSQFTGSLDGRAYEVQKLNITGSKGALSATEVAFFSSTSSSAVIRNIGLTNVNLNTIYSSVITLRSMAGLVAYNGGTIVNSYVTGGKFVNTTTGGTPVATAGLVGQNKVGGRIENSYAMANVTSEGTSTTAANAAAAGGLVGANNGTIKNCYSHGNVTAKSGNKDSNAGGLAGSSFNSSPPAVLSNSYAAGILSATAGGTASKHGFTTLLFGTFSNNYWDTETSAGSSAALTGATGLSTAEMKAVSGTYPSALGDQFIFTSGSYPKLKYGGKADGHCGGSTNVTCGAAIRGQ